MEDREMTDRFHRDVLLILSLVLLGAIPWSPAQTAEVLDFTEFTRVEVGSGMRIDIHQAETFHVEVGGPPDLLDRLQVDQDGDLLRFQMEHRQWRGTSGRGIEISIQMPELASLRLSGGSRGEVRMENPTADFHARLSGGSQLEGRVVAGAMDFRLSGGSRTALAGSTSELELAASGGSQLDLSGLQCDRVNATRMSGGSRATVATNGTIDATLSGGSRIRYYGDATVGSVQASGGGRVEPAR
jgi:hypothetical protein